MALRLHRPSYRNDAELGSELAWMQTLVQAGLSVPKPLACQEGHLLRRFGDRQVSLLSWLDGHPLGQSGKALEAWVGPLHFFELGKTLAHLHQASDAWSPPADFQRWSWDREGLLGDDPLWDRFWQNPALSNADKAVMVDFRQRASDALEEASDIDFGLVHADPVRENLLVQEGKVQLIDFDDGGWGYRLFDLATALRPNKSEPNYNALKSALSDGYHQVRALDLSLLSLFECTGLQL